MYMEANYRNLRHLHVTCARTHPSKPRMLMPQQVLKPYIYSMANHLANKGSTRIYVYISMSACKWSKMQVPCWRTKYSVHTFPTTRPGIRILAAISNYSVVVFEHEG
jgi:hypothetical protein